MNIIFWLKFDYGNFPFGKSNFALNTNKNVQNTQTSADDNYANTINAIETSVSACDLLTGLVGADPGFLR